MCVVAVAAVRLLARLAVGYLTLEILCGRTLTRVRRVGKEEDDGER